MFYNAFSLPGADAATHLILALKPFYPSVYYSN